MAGDEVGGRLFFTSAQRGLIGEDEIVLTSLGVDIGSSTTHLAFSRIVLERTDTRYIVAARKVLFESDILLTPYTSEDTIDAGALDAFFGTQYRRSGISFDQIDTGALILTGTAVRRRNARAIASLFAQAAGKFVSISAGDEMEAILAAFGSGAAARSQRSGMPVLNIDVGGGTSKIALCRNGGVECLTVLDVGARLVAFDGARRITRLEPAARDIAQACGLQLGLGGVLGADELERLTQSMADSLIEAVTGGEESALTRRLHRLPPFDATAASAGVIVFSGGVSEYIYGRETRDYGDLGPLLAQKLRERVQSLGIAMAPPAAHIRATVIGASQYTVQVSGSTIFVSQPDVLPLRNIPAIRPTFPLDPEKPDVEAIAAGVRAAVTRLGPADGEQVIAICYGWRQSATFARLDAFCRGLCAALEEKIVAGIPVVLVGERDVGGLIGIHLAGELGLTNPIVSIDGVTLQEFDHIDVGTLLDGAGSVPVIVKSLVFPESGAGQGRT